MRFLFATCLLTLLSDPTATACDPPSYITGELARNAVVKDVTFVQKPDETFWRKLQDLASPFDTLSLLSCGTFQSDVGVASLAGTPAGDIRVVAIRAFPGSSQVDEWSEAVKTIQKVWAGKFRYATSSIIWSEGNPWTVAASVDYINGSKGSLLTDGVHVKLLDSSGHYWYLRLLPAAQ